MQDQKWIFGGFLKIWGLATFAHISLICDVLEFNQFQKKLDQAHSFNGIQVRTTHNTGEEQGASEFVFRFLVGQLVWTNTL